jgi:DNA (cytosine-5)-methyltransferase 1
MENSPMLTLRGLNRVTGDLTEMGYDARWGVVSASNTGAPHRRERIWIFANSKGIYVEKQKVVGEELQKGGKRKFGGASHLYADTISAPCWYGDQPSMVGLDDGVSKYVDRAKAAGNGQVPIVAATAWRILSV